MEIETLIGIVGNKERVITEDIPEIYQTDILGRLKGCAQAVVKPVTTQQVSQIMRYANQNKIPVTPRGAGTNLVGSTVPDRGGIVLDLSDMNRIIEVDQETMTATVEPGVVLQDFQQYVESLGLFYPPDPGEKLATIGGNISTNAGGMRAVKYGVTRDYVQGLEVVLADGTIMELGSKNRKDSSGLSLTNLVTGAEGTLAVITKCIVKLITRPETSVSAVIPFAGLQSGIENVLAIQKLSVHPTALEFVERKVIRLGEEFLSLTFPYPEAEAYIILTIDGDEQQTQKELHLIRETVLQHGALDFLILDEEALTSRVWKIRGTLVKAVEAVSEQEPIDIVVPVNRTAEFVHYVNELQNKTGVTMVSFGHAGDGNVHLCVLKGQRTDEEWMPLRQECLSALYSKAYELGGLTSGEHGIGLTKKPFFIACTDPAKLTLMRQIKHAFDTNGILNADKSYL